MRWRTSKKFLSMCPTRNLIRQRNFFFLFCVSNKESDKAKEKKQIPSIIKKKKKNNKETPQFKKMPL